MKKITKKKSFFLLIFFLTTFLLIGIHSALAWPWSTESDEFGESEEINDPLLVQTQYGLVYGKEYDEDTFCWLGIPYAKPPIDELRWKAPEDPDPWDGIKNTEEFSDPSVQISTIFGSDNLDDIENKKIMGNEDCLYLNIWKPIDSENEDLPVYFFIHGGGYNYGHGGTDLCNGANLANKADCIVITFNYRLGVAGFFKNLVQTGNTLDSSGNFGFLDIIKALEWTKENIENFGGDSDNIIIAGESAGGFSVFALQTSPYVQEEYFDNGIQLFHAAVTESAIISTTDSETAESNSVDLLSNILFKNGLVETEEEAIELINDATDEEIDSWFREETMEDLISLTQGESENLLTEGFSMMGISDGYVIAENLYSRWQNGNFIKVPTILGSNEDEIKLFAAVMINPTLQFDENSELSDLIEEVIITLFNTIINSIIEDSILDIEIPSSFEWLLEITYETMVDVITDIIFTTLGCELPAILMSEYVDNIFVYEFCWNQQPEPFDVFIGACHAMELPFIFGNMEDEGILGSIWTEENEQGRIALSNAMISYWKNFIHNGDPGDPDGGWFIWEGLPEWDNFDKWWGTEKIFFDANNYKVNIYMN